MDVNDDGVIAITVTPTWTRFSTSGTKAATYRFLDVGGLPAGQYYVWGYQLETGVFPTSYIPTTSAAVTRDTDRITIPVGSWFNLSSGSFYMDVDFLSGVSTANSVSLLSLNHGGTADEISYDKYPGQDSFHF